MGNVIEDAYREALLHDCPNGCAPTGTPCNGVQVCAIRIPGGKPPNPHKRSGPHA